jgi:hypothetical protein
MSELSVGFLVSDMHVECYTCSGSVASLLAHPQHLPSSLARLLLARVPAAVSLKP